MTTPSFCAGMLLLGSINGGGMPILQAITPPHENRVGPCETSYVHCIIQQTITSQLEYSYGEWVKRNVLPNTNKHLASYLYLIIGYSHLHLMWNHRVEYLWWNIEATCNLTVSNYHLSHTALPDSTRVTVKSWHIIIILGTLAILATWQFTQVKTVLPKF